MIKCPSCSSIAPDGSRYCPSCGVELPSISESPTEVASPEKRIERRPPKKEKLKGDTRKILSDSFEESRFLPGMILAGRYRIVSLLGKGGMGEVYRAEDLKLGQPVALKFLPEELQRDETLLNQLLNEVKLSRQVSHPNVCRVYDIGEVDGQHFLSMEYVDGEDLASLLRRIGHLPKDKAVQIAQQLCAGLASAHEQGILHRDLKPANVMIDGKGRARITDFGLASLGGDIEGKEVRAGTPAYMAPEQLAGKEVTVRSDIYSLGLVLYELFTGRRAFKARTQLELARLQQDSTPTNPSSFIEGFDPAVERMIMHCLNRESQDRPASVLAVAAGLPGGDPLAAALAAGEIPSPEMVADARGVGALKPIVGLVILILIILSLIIQPLLDNKRHIVGSAPLEKPPETLSVEARQIIEQAGYEKPPIDSIYGFEYDSDYLEYVKDQAISPAKWNDLASVQPSPIFFWYRQSPRYLVSSKFFMSDKGPILVTPDEPPWIISGMIGVRLDPEGRLLQFQAVPPQFDDSQELGSEFEWPKLFEAAGLELKNFRPTLPKWNPLTHSDSRFAWEGVYSNQPEIPIRIEATSYRGKAVYFEVIPPWRKPDRMIADQEERGNLAVNILFLSILFILLFGGILLARRNLRMSRGDRRGSFRLAFFFFSINMLWWILRAHHVPTFYEIGLFFQAVSACLLVSCVVWIIYMALEPYARSIWPDVMISWNRLLAGRLRDPLIGRDILIGGLAFVYTSVWYGLANLFGTWISLPSTPFQDMLETLTGIRYAAAQHFLKLMVIFAPIAWLFLVLLLRMIFRKQLLAVGIIVLILSTIFGFQAATPLLTGLFIAGVAALFFFILIRFGLLCAVFWELFFFSSQDFVLTWNPSFWYADRFIFIYLAHALILIYGFYISLAGRSLLKTDLLEK